MEIIQLYKCLCDVQRLRILNLLREGPLCVCHLMEILEVDQVKMSKQLQYMKKLGLLEVEKVAQWRVYRIADLGTPLLDQNLSCLQECGPEDLRFAEDLAARKRVMKDNVAGVVAGGCGSC